MSKLAAYPRDQFKHISPRIRRLLSALLNGPVFREQADRIACASNSPELIRQLKRVHGLRIKTERIPRVDRDGLVTYPGLYVLEEDSIELAKALLRNSQPAADAS